MKPHSVSAFSALEADTRLSSSVNEIGTSGLGGVPAWMCHTGLVRRCLHILALIAFEELLVLVDMARDDVEDRAASPPSARDT